MPSLGFDCFSSIINWVLLSIKGLLVDLSFGCEKGSNYGKGTKKAFNGGNYFKKTSPSSKEKNAFAIVLVRLRTMHVNSCLYVSVSKFHESRLFKYNKLIQRFYSLFLQQNVTERSYFKKSIFRKYVLSI